MRSTRIHADWGRAGGRTRPPRFFLGLHLPMIADGGTDHQRNAVSRPTTREAGSRVAHERSSSASASERSGSGHRREALRATSSVTDRNARTSSPVVQYFIQKRKSSVAAQAKKKGEHL